jgi:GNAT superfamily N-acetyltransferase
MTVLVRTAVPEDRASCLELIEILTGKAPDDGWIETYDRLLSGDRGEILVAVEDDGLLGVATVSYNLAIRYGGEYCQLEELIVSPAARGKNAGGSLVQTAVERARNRGCGEMGLYLVDRSEGNRPFYEKYGFEIVGSEMRQRFE